MIPSDIKKDQKEERNDIHWVYLENGQKRLEIPHSVKVFYGIRKNPVPRELRDYVKQ